MRNREKFKSDLTKTFKEAYLAASDSSLKVDLDENESIDSMKKKISKAASDSFALSMSDSLPKIIDDYLDSLEFDTTKLTAAGSPVAGILKIVK